MEANKMNISRTVKGWIYSKMEKLGLLDLEDGEYIKVPNSPFMDLHVERHIEDDGTGNDIDVIYLSHTYLQNGDVMSDPHIRVMVNRELKAASAIYYQQDALGIYQTIRGPCYREDGSEFYGINLQAEKSCNSFLILWLDNIKNQGFDIKSLLSPIVA